MIPDGWIKYLFGFLVSSGIECLKNLKSKELNFYFHPEFD